ncbi:uncharacterized protein [Triticum aestivum]|uniref:uncharacterized protein n=1 Tax=Triticum aestivum TaxID=4565 RepID=UPI001D01DAA8|nr:uncharacterized protein LOC123140685 [Triticum aestivum]
MMDPDEISTGCSRVDYVPDAPSGGSKRRRDSVTAVSGAITRVLDDDNLLGEILLRVDFLTTLVRTATVCRQWLRQASDPVFLRRFRKLHPPRLLGFYLSNCLEQSPRFVPTPMPQTSEFADVTHRASFQFNTYKYHSIGLSIVDCWGGNVFVTLHKYDTGKIEYPFAVHRPLLCVQSSMTIFPPLPCHQLQSNFL